MLTLKVSLSGPTSVPDPDRIHLPLSIDMEVLGATSLNIDNSIDNTLALYHLSLPFVSPPAGHVPAAAHAHGGMAHGPQRISSDLAPSWASPRTRSLSRRGRACVAGRRPR